LTCGAVGGPLFIVAFVVEGATRSGYDAVRHPVSSLALGPFGWSQIANFVVTGALMLGFAFGLRRVLRPGRGWVWAPWLVGAYAVGLIGAGIFITDPVSGYPAGTPDEISYTWHGTLHDLFSLPVFGCLPAACFVLASRFRAQGRFGWAGYSVVSGVSFLVAFVLASLGFGQVEGLVEVGGLNQRIAIVIGWVWLTLLALHLRRTVADT
jgi:hypothetical protein